MQNASFNIIAKDQLAVTIMYDHIHTTTNILDALHPFLPI